MAYMRKQCFDDSISFDSRYLMDIIALIKASTAIPEQ